MQNFSLAFVLYCPIYVYVFMVLYLIALVNSSNCANTTMSLNAFHQFNKAPIMRILFILTLASMLGTPPTLGFFAKMLSFYMLVQIPGLALYASILLTLVLIIFYLQSIRTRGVLRRRNAYSSGFTFSNNNTKLVYGQILFITFTLIVPVVFDIIYCWLI